MILFDTSVLSRVFRRGRLGAEEQRLAQVIEGLISEEPYLGLPGVVLQEILSGVRLDKQFAELEHRITAAFTILLPSASDYVEAARLKNKCLSKGLTASGPDCLIAVQTISAKAELFTLDADFTAIAKQTPLKLFKF